jgi:hypothetical protein
MVSYDGKFDGREVYIESNDEEKLIGAVDVFADRMKTKLLNKHKEGKIGWDDPDWPIGDIKKQLIEHIEKGDFIDVANFAMFAWNKK